MRRNASVASGLAPSHVPPPVRLMRGSTAAPLLPPGFAGRLSDWVQIIRYEFQEWPDLRVTAADASRVWGLEDFQLEAVLDAFVQAGLLSRSPDGVYSLRERSHTVATSPA